MVKQWLQSDRKQHIAAADSKPYKLKSVLVQHLDEYSYLFLAES